MDIKASLGTRATAHFVNMICLVSYVMYDNETVCTFTKNCHCVLELMFPLFKNEVSLNFNERYWPNGLSLIYPI